MQNQDFSDAIFFFFSADGLLKVLLYIIFDWLLSYQDSDRCIRNEKILTSKNSHLPQHDPETAIHSNANLSICSFSVPHLCWPSLGNDNIRTSTI